VTMPTLDCDDLVMGSGMAGLAVAARLADAGRRVIVVEAHDTPGGYAHTFELGRYRFCAQVHYIFGCRPGGSVHGLLDELDLVEQVPFIELDPDGYDQIVVAGDRYCIPSGWDIFRGRMVALFPGEAVAIDRYFDVVAEIADELSRLPDAIGLRDVLAAPFRFPRLIQMRGWTLERLFDKLRLSPRVRTVLAGQCGDYLLPPTRVSLLLHATLVTAYGSGAFYPRQHYSHLVDTLVGSIAARPDCRVLLEHEVDRIEVEAGRVVGVHTQGGRTLRAERFISNMDPRATVTLGGTDSFPRKFVNKVSDDYSYGGISLYLGLRDIDLREFGFGSYNVWSYPHDDLDRIYSDQGERNDLSDPWLFMSTATLHSDEPGLAPPGCQTLQVATHASYAEWKALRDRDPRAYRREKKRLRNHLLDVIDERFIPGLRDHIDVFALGTPTTNERFVRAPQGNSYGAALTPEHVNTSRRPQQALENLWLVNASAGWPSVAGTVGAGSRLADQLLEGDS
jgi:phytoene dehydrogenase-like protein